MSFDSPTHTEDASNPKATTSKRGLRTISNLALLAAVSTAAAALISGCGGDGASSGSGTSGSGENGTGGGAGTSTGGSGENGTGGSTSGTGGVGTSTGGSGENGTGGSTSGAGGGEGNGTGGSGSEDGVKWSSAKWGGGGYVSGLIYHPTTANLLYARTDVGGAYRRDPTTLAWVPLTDGFGAAENFHQGVESIALDPNDDNIVYMVTGVYVSAEATARLYISKDRGATWSTVVDLPFAAGGNNTGRAIGERLSVDPNKPSTLFFGSRTAGLWTSTDSGKTWAQVSSLSSAKFDADQLNAVGGSAVGVELTIFDTTTKGTGSATSTIYAAIAPDYVTRAGLTSILYRSTDGGANWSPVSTPVSDYYIPHMVRADDGMFYVAFTKGVSPGDPGPASLYKFDGTNWTLLRSNDSGGYGGLSVSGSGSTTRIALGVSGTWGNFDGQEVVQVSDDGGGNWHEIAATMPHTPASDEFSGWIDDVEIDPSDPDHVMHVYGGGIWETFDASASSPSWSLGVEQLEETCTLSLTTPPSGAPYTLLNASGDVGAWVYTDLSKTPTLSPYKAWSNGNSLDTAWSDPAYVAASVLMNNTEEGAGFWSGDGGKTWAEFETFPTGAVDHAREASNVAVTARNNLVWAPTDSIPSYTTDNGSTWTPTDLPAFTINEGWPHAYRMIADRQNPNKVYAYDSGGVWWGTSGKVFVSTDGGHTFTLSDGSVSANLRANPYNLTSLAVNPHVEGDLWLADGNDVYHSEDSGSSWTKLNVFASIWGSRDPSQWPEVQGATDIALGKAKDGASYSAAIYVLGVIDDVWGVYLSEDGGATWTRFNDDAHQFGGPGVIAADQDVYGRIYLGGSCRGILYSN